MVEMEGQISYLETELIEVESIFVWERKRGTDRKRERRERERERETDRQTERVEKERDQ